MKLYSIQASNNCRRVNAVIAHLGLQVDLVEPNLAAGDLKKSEYLAINPNAKVPALEDGDLKLWESRAIMIYLAQQKRDGGLWPQDLRAQADVLRWQFWEASHLSKATGAFAFERLFKKVFVKQEADPAAVAAAEKDFHQFAPVLNARLEGRTWLVGSALTVADFSVGACFSFAEPSGLPWGDYKHVQAWYGRLGEVPAWRDTAPKLG